ncbi:MAG: hypothetical protein M3Y41_11405 [Pseudomonadota bacterium]|nr:hypothetical protein [Pseudomonadota bacterium]
MTAAVSASAASTTTIPTTLTAPKADAGSGTQSAQQSRAQDQAKLNQLMRSYQAGISRGESASALSSLGKQITAEAKLLGQNVRLPKATAAPAAASNGAAATAAASTPKSDTATPSAHGVSLTV